MFYKLSTINLISFKRICWYWKAIKIKFNENSMWPVFNVAAKNVHKVLFHTIN